MNATVPVDDDLYDNPNQGSEPEPEPSKMENIRTVASKGKPAKVMLITGVLLITVAGAVASGWMSVKKVAPLPAEVSGVTTGSSPTLNTRNNPTLANTAGYQEMVAKMDDRRTEAALQSGGSVQPLAANTASNLIQTKPGVDGAAQAPAPTPVPQYQQVVPTPAPQYQQVVQYQGTPQAADPVHQRMIENAQAYLLSLEAGRAKGLQVFQVSSSEVKPDSTAGANMVAGANPGTGAAGPSAQPTVATSRTLIPAGTIYSARIESAVNTDLNGEFAATLVTGPYTGAQLVGVSKLVGEAASLQFKSLSLPGRGITISISAIALDAVSREAGTATDVDRKLLVKYGLKPLAAGIAAAGKIIGTAGTSINVNGSTVATTTPEITGSTTRDVMLGAAAEQVSQDANAFNTTPTVRVAPGTVVGIFFTADAIYMPK